MTEFLQTSFFQTAVTEWCSCMIYIALTKKKRRGISLAGICILMLLVQNLLLYMTFRQPEGLTFLPWLFIRMPLYLAGMWVFIWLCCDVPVIDVTYLCVRSFMLAELAWALVWEWQIQRAGSALDTSTAYDVYSAYGTEPSGGGGASSALVILLVYAAVFGLMYLLERQIKRRVERFRTTLHELILVSVIALITFLLTSFFASHDTTVLDGQITLSHSLVNFVGILFVFVYRLWFANLQAAHELDMIHRVVEQQAIQYDSSRESMDAVNRKYHDIKQMLSAMRSEVTQEKKIKWIDDMEQEIREYEVWCKTGNPVLDVLISEKYLRCVHEEIELSCVIDGEQLKDMEMADICTIFGNALDNAIEHVCRIREKERRLIHVKVFERQGFLNISIENILEGELKMEDGIPVTTKEEKEFHGYGIKSIQYAVSRYHGAMTIDQKDNWFYLKLIFPLPLKK